MRRVLSLRVAAMMAMLILISSCSTGKSATPSVQLDSSASIAQSVSQDSTSVSFTMSSKSDISKNGVVEPEVVIENDQPHAYTTAELNLRKGPATTYDVIEIIPQGASVVENGYTPSTPDWVFVSYKGTLGWVAEEYLSYGGGGKAKPVIYLYPTKVTDVQVKMEFETGGFTCTYPEYNGGWNVTAWPSGRLVNKADGREYSYLYWEGDGDVQYDMSAGFVVRGSDTAGFLQEKLEYMGLTPKEYNEFIVYWLPLMQVNPYNFITFQGSAYTDNARLKVFPQPDSLLRVFMVYQPLDKPIQMPEQKLTPFSRTGFAVVEWGGERLSARPAS